jgi:hypothetical protein
MNRACKSIYATERKRSHERSELNLQEQNIHASSPAGAGQAIRPLKNNFVRIKKISLLIVSLFFVIMLKAQNTNYGYKAGSGGNNNTFFLTETIYDLHYLNPCVVKHGFN